MYHFHLKWISTNPLANHQECRACGWGLRDQVRILFEQTLKKTRSDDWQYSQSRHLPATLKLPTPKSNRQQSFSALLSQRPSGYCYYNNKHFINWTDLCILHRPAPDAQIITEECIKQLNSVLTSIGNEEIMALSFLTLQSRLLQMITVKDRDRI